MIPDLWYRAPNERQIAGRRLEAGLQIKISSGGYTLPRILLRKVFRWELVIRALFIPENTDYIPALAVVEKLKAVDAAREGLFADGIAGFVGAENVGFLAKLFGLARELAFKKGVFAFRMLLRQNSYAPP